MKKWLTGLLTLTLGVALIGCAGQEQPNNTAEEPGNAGGEKVLLKFATWGNPAQLELYKGLTDTFTQQHPNIEVQIDTIPFADYQQKMSVLAAGRELPDIAWVSERMVPQFMANDILADVSDIVQDEAFDSADIIPSTLELFRQDGKLYGLPFSTPPSVVFYNEDLFKQAGLSTPNELAEKGEWTWEKFEEAAKAIKTSAASPNVYGANFFRDWKTWIILASYSWSNGSGPFNPEMTEYTWNDQYGVETLEMLKRMMFTDGSHPKAGEQVNFESGQIGMIFDNYSFVSKAREIQNFKWSIAPMPAGSKGSVPMMGQAGYVLFKDGKHPEEAKELLKFLAGKEGVQKTSAFFVPPRQSVLNSEEFLNVEGNPDAGHIKQAVIDEMPKAVVQPGHIRWQNIDTEILTGFDALFAGRSEPQQIQDEVKSKVDALLSK
ncbi:MAG: sugar ABC transporter substrate-binding protein [Paenibacillus macerans]|uniref:ABC transporter substrate-binding protein n=1 Tax=Paenibacillus TaxID=44249 RepID=UPI000EF0DECF|nr:sugar ABC transporter substrate-binding protein [Paenibacillus macerans]MBS5913788.1 sugar ABC transporter substrate-binding protein [Paenibacillus macerans]MDU5946260.1 sugar ABC transporter substrate-binding protein [Paenibacillus macerans]MDU7473108.1 sugar ABC transporter substrate-binding protein [Paenibacillus macerans]UMV49028.1 sugar ABC transporter substrate-binding protein [Paenibacillus macerans]GBK65666.1 sugar ABC transporter substrate-binding protein [Paenibacillus macerans]